MDADFSVEIGGDAPALELPWRPNDGTLAFVDLRRNPEALKNISEAALYPELRDFLSALNSESTIFRTAKCDVWTDAELDPAEEIYEGTLRLGSYVDVLFAPAANALRNDFDVHEKLATRVVELLARAPDMPSVAELVIRRCFFIGTEAEAGESGYYISLYVYGYGDDEADARKRWAIAMALMQNALLQISAELKRNL